MTPTDHAKLLVEQFTKQAVPFSRWEGHSNESAMKRIIEMMRVGPEDTVLDVACGPGLVAIEFARIARHVTGIDLTPAMIDRARDLQRETGLTNLTWEVGDGAALPYPDGAFSLVLSRYTFHHLIDPGSVLREMVRVCAPGGRVAVIDASPEAEKADAYDRMETLRDPSHVRAMPAAELFSLMVAAGLDAIESDFHRLETDLDTALAGSFPNPGDAERLRALFEEDLGRDRLGVGAYEKDGKIRFSYPIVALVGTKPG